MIPYDTLALFFAASVALALAPGPDNIFVLTQSALHGRWSGLLVTLGLCTGLLVHTAAVSLGVAAVFQTSALAFNVLKTVGAAYLLYLAWRALRAGAAEFGETGKPGLSRRQPHTRGIVMNVTNPKGGDFLPGLPAAVCQSGARRASLQMILLGAVFMLAALIVFGAIAWTAGLIGERFQRSQRAQIAINRLAATVFAGLALRLAFSK